MTESSPAWPLKVGPTVVEQAPPMKITVSFPSPPLNVAGLIPGDF